MCIFLTAQQDMFTFTNNILMFTKAENSKSKPDLLTKHTLFKQKVSQQWQCVSTRVQATYLTYNVFVISEPLVLEQTGALGPDTQRDRVVHGHTHGDGVTHDDNLWNKSSENTSQPKCWKSQRIYDVICR